MENLTSSDITIIQKEAQRKSAKDIAFLTDQSVESVQAYLQHLSATAGIITHQSLLDARKKPRKEKPLQVPAVLQRRQEEKRRQAENKKLKLQEEEKAAQRARERKGRSQREYEQAEKRRSESRAQFKTIARDYSKMISVRIDEKTIIYCKPGETPEQARLRWLENAKRYAKPGFNRGIIK